MDFDIFRQVNDLKKKKIYVIGLGNDLRKDDGVGIYIARNIIEKHNVKVFYDVNRFESAFDEIVKWKPEYLFLVDSINFGDTPGKIRQFDYFNIKSDSLFSTHKFPFDILINLIKSNVPSIRVIIIGIMPEDFSFGIELSSQVKISAQKIINFFNNLLNK